MKNQNVPLKVINKKKQGSLASQKNKDEAGLAGETSNNSVNEITQVTVNPTLNNTKSTD